MTGDKKTGSGRRRSPKAAGVSEAGLAGMDLMPTDADAVRILAARARALRGETEEAETGTRVSYVRFRLGSRERYGIPYAHVSEVMPASGIVRVPGTPETIRGVVSRRGELLTVLDLKKFFRVDRSDYGDEAAIIIASGAGLTVGILADGIDGEDEYIVEGLMAPFPSEGISDIHHVIGIHDGRVTVLNVESLLGDPSIVVDDAN